LSVHDQIPLVLPTLALMTCSASAPQRTIDDSRGNVVGRESASDNQTTIYDARGRNIGRTK
jgi:hypothetical protein